MEERYKYKYLGISIREWGEWKREGEGEREGEGRRE